MNNPHIQDTFTAQESGFPSGPATGLYEITPSDANDLTVGTRALYVETPGDVALSFFDGSSVIVPLIAGWHPVAPKRVLSTGTTALGIYGAV